MKWLAFLPLAAFLGCASIESSIFDGGSNQKKVKGGAAEYYYLERSHGPFRPVVGSEINPWIFGNLLHPMGYLIDAFSGAMWTPPIPSQPQPK